MTYLYHCSKCKKTVAIEEKLLSSGVYACEGCGEPMVSSGLTEAQWAALSEAEQKHIYASILRNRCSARSRQSFIVAGLMVLAGIAGYLVPSADSFGGKPWVFFLFAAGYLLLTFATNRSAYRNCADKTLAFLRAAAEAKEAEEKRVNPWEVGAE